MADIQVYAVYTIIFFVFTLLLQLFLHKPSKKATKLRLPISPPSLPIIGHLHLLTSHVHKGLHSIATTYGPLVLLRIGTAKCVLVSSASMAAEVFKHQDVVFSNRPQFAFSDELPYGSSGFFAAPYGVYWRFMKKLTITELLGPKQIELSRIVRNVEIERYLRKMVDSSEREEVLDMGAELMKVTNNTICTMVMSTRCSGKNEEAEKIRKLVKETVEMAAKVSFGDVFGWPLKRVGFWLFGAKARDVTLKYDAILEVILKRHEERGKREGYDREDKDLMDIILKVFYDENAEYKLNRINIKSFLLELFLGGTSTLTEVTQWIMAELINHPEAIKRVREEISTAVGNSKRLVQESDLPNLPYFQAVVKESLRLHPAAPLAFRRCSEATKLDGYDVPKDTTIAVNLYSIMRDPQVWENPDQFDPERFLNSSNKYEIKGLNSTYVPFGGGRRGCPGAGLAYTMANMMVATSVQCFDWKVNGDGGAMVDMEVGAGVSLPLAKPFRLQPVLRFNPYDLEN